MKSLEDLPEAGFLSAVLNESKHGWKRRSSGRKARGSTSTGAVLPDDGLMSSPESPGDAAPAAGLTYEEFLEAQGAGPSGTVAPRDCRAPSRGPFRGKARCPRKNGRSQGESALSRGAESGTKPAGGKSELRAAVDYILSLESRREYPSLEIRRKTEGRFGSDVAEQALAYAESKGYVSDERFAKAFAESRIASLYGRIRIMADLRTKGIDSGTAEEILSALSPDWSEMAREAFRKKFRGADMSDPKMRVKAFRFLAARGFSSDEASAALGGGDDI